MAGKVFPAFMAQFCVSGKRPILTATQFMKEPTHPIHKMDISLQRQSVTLRWRHNGRFGISNHQPHDYLLNRSFRRRSKKTSKLRVTGLGAGNSPVTGEFPAQMASNAENVSIWWRHHGSVTFLMCKESFSQCFTRQSFTQRSCHLICCCIIQTATQFINEQRNWHFYLNR